MEDEIITQVKPAYFTWVLFELISKPKTSMSLTKMLGLEFLGTQIEPLFDDYVRWEPTTQLIAQPVLHIVTGKQIGRAHV